MGVFALALALLHPMSLAAGGGGPKLLTSWDVPWFVVVGKVTLIILTIHVVFALLRSTLRFNYQTWKNVHAVAPLPILIGAFVHSWFAGADLNIFQFQAYWIALLTLAAAALFHKRIKVGAGAGS
jgi:phosphatidylserine synthase